MAYTYKQIRDLQDYYGLDNMSTRDFSLLMQKNTVDPEMFEAGLDTGFGKAVKNTFYWKDKLLEGSGVNPAFRGAAAMLGGGHKVQQAVGTVPGMLGDMVAAGAAVPASAGAVPAAIISGLVFGALSAGHTYEQTDSVPIAAASGIGMGLVPLAGVGGGALVRSMLGRPAVSNALAMSETLAAREGLMGAANTANAEMSAAMGRPVVDLLKGGQSLSPGLDFATRLGHEAGSLIGLQTSGAVTNAVAVPWGEKLDAFGEALFDKESLLTNTLFQAGFGGLGLIKSARGSADAKYLKEYGKTLEMYLDRRTDLPERPTNEPIMEPGFVSPARATAHEAAKTEIAQRLEQVDMFPTEELRTSELVRLQSEHDTAKAALEQHRTKYESELPTIQGLPEPERIAAIQANGRTSQDLIKAVAEKSAELSKFQETTLAPQGTSPVTRAQALNERLNPVEGAVFHVDAMAGHRHEAAPARLTQKQLNELPDVVGQGDWDVFKGVAKSNGVRLLELNNIHEGDRVSFNVEGKIRNGIIQNGMIRDERGLPWGIDGVLSDSDAWIQKSPKIDPVESPHFSVLYDDPTGKLVVVGDQVFAQAKEGAPWATIEGEQEVTSEMLSNFLAGESVSGVREARPEEVARLESARQSRETERGELDTGVFEARPMAYTPDLFNATSGKSEAEVQTNLERVKAEQRNKNLGDLFAEAPERTVEEINQNISNLRKEHVDAMRAFLETTAGIKAENLDRMDAKRLREVYEREYVKESEKSGAERRRQEANDFIQARAKTDPAKFAAEWKIVEAQLPFMGDNAKYAFVRWRTWAKSEHANDIGKLKSYLSKSEGKFRGTNKGLWGVWGLDSHGLPKTRQAGEAKRGDEQFTLHKYKTPGEAGDHARVLNLQLEPGSKPWEVRKIPYTRGLKSQPVVLESGAESAHQSKEYFYVVQKEVDHVQALLDDFESKVDTAVEFAGETRDWVVEKASDKDAVADYLDALIYGVQVEDGSRRVGGFVTFDKDGNPDYSAIERMFGGQKELEYFHGYVLKRFMRGVKGKKTYDKNQRMQMYLDSYEEYFSPLQTKDMRARKLIEEFTGGKLIPASEWEGRKMELEKVESEPLRVSKNEPKLVSASLRGDRIYLDVDATGHIPTVDELQEIFGPGVDIIAFKPDLVSGTRGVASFALDVFVDGRISSKAAKDAYEKVFGDTKDVRADSVFMSAPLKLRMKMGLAFEGDPKSLAEVLREPSRDEGIPFTFGDGKFMLIGLRGAEMSPRAKARFERAAAMRKAGVEEAEIARKTGVITIPDGTGLPAIELGTDRVKPNPLTVAPELRDKIPSWGVFNELWEAGGIAADPYRESLLAFEQSPVDYTNVKTVSDLIDGDWLFKAYPELAKLPVLPVDGIGGSIAQDNSIIHIGTSNNQSAMRKVMLHEIQHYIQHLEGFLPGTPSILPELKRVHDLGEKYGLKLLSDAMFKYRRALERAKQGDTSGLTPEQLIAKHPEISEVLTVMSKENQFQQYSNTRGELLAERSSQYGHFKDSWLRGMDINKSVEGGTEMSVRDWTKYQESYLEITGRDLPKSGEDVGETGWDNVFAIPSLAKPEPLMWGEQMAWTRIVERMGLGAPELRAFAARLSTMFDNVGMGFGEIGGAGTEKLVGLHAVEKETRKQIVFLNSNPKFSKYVKMFSLAHEVNGHGFFEMVDKAKARLAMDPKYDPMPDFGLTRRQVEQTEEARHLMENSNTKDRNELLHQLIKALPEEFRNEKELTTLFDLTSDNPDEVMANFNAVVSLAIVADHTNARTDARAEAVRRAGNRVAELVRWLPKPISDLIVNFAKWARPFFRVITANQHMIEHGLAEGLAQTKFAGELHDYLNVLTSVMKVHEQNTKAALEGQRWLNAMTPGRTQMEINADGGVRFLKTARMELGREDADRAAEIAGFVGPNRDFKLGAWDKHYGLLSSLAIKYPEMREMIFDATFNESQRVGGMFDFMTALGQIKEGTQYVEDKTSPINIVANHPELYKLRNRLQLHVQKEPEITVGQLYAAKNPELMKIIGESGLSLPQVELTLKAIGAQEQAHQIYLNFVEKQRIEIVKSRGAYILMSLDSSKPMDRAKIEVNNYVTGRLAGQQVTTGDVRIDNVLNQMLKQIGDSMKVFRLNKAYINLSRTGPIKVDVIWKTKSKARDVFDAHSEVEFEKKRDAYLANPDVLSVTRRVESDKDLRFNTDSIHELHAAEVADSQRTVDMVLKAFGDKVDREQLQKIVDSNSTIGQYVAERLSNQMDQPGPGRRNAGGMEGVDLLHQQYMWASRVGRGLTRSLSDANFNLLRISPELKDHPALPTLEQAYANFKQRDPAGVGVVQNVNFAKGLLGNFFNYMQDTAQPLLGLLPGNLVGDPLNLGKVSVGEIYGLVTKAMKDVKIFHTSREKLDGERRKVVEDFRRGNVGLGHAETVENTEMLAVSAARRKADGYDPSSLLGDLIKRPLSFVMSKGKRVGKLFSDFGETSTMLASFDFYKKLGYDYDTAYRYAFDMTKSTNGSAGKMGRSVTMWNNPELRPIAAAVNGLQNYQNSVTSILMSQFQRGFLSYGQDSLPMRKTISNILGRTGELSKAEQVAAKKAFLVGFGTMLTVGGLMGIPGYGALLKLAELAGWNAKEDLLKGLNAIDPTDGPGAMMALHGFGNVIGFDIGSRMGLGGMLGLNPYSGFDPAQIFGVTGGVAKGLALGAVDVLHGNFGSALERNAPNMLARPLKMWRDDWEFRDGDGTKMIDTSTPENIMYSVFGVKPNRLMQIEELRNIQKADSTIRKAQNVQWVDEQAVGIVRGDVEGVKQAIDKRVEENPELKPDALMELIAQQYVDRTFPYNPALEPGAKSPLMAMLPGGEGRGDNVARLQAVQNVKLMLGGKLPTYLQPKQDKFERRADAAERKAKREALLQSMLQGASPEYLSNRTQPSKTQTPRNPYERAVLLDQMLGRNGRQSVGDMVGGLR